LKTQHGFSLIELLIVVTIIGILSAIAIPAYSDYVLRGKVTDATSALSTSRTKLEQFFQDNRTYVGGPNVTVNCNATDTASSQNFDFLCNAAAATYTLTATGKSSMAGFSYTLDQSGAKTSTIASPASANWVASSANCWITKKGGTC
jgi:type IV pilus assembly protein PilE